MLSAQSDIFLFGTVGFVGGGPGQITTLANGNIAVVWTNATNFLQTVPGFDDTEVTMIGARIFDPSGNALTDAFQVNTATGGGQSDPRIAALDNGNFVVTWTHGPGIPDFDVDARAQIFDATGTRIGPEIPLNAVDDEDQNFTGVSALPGGGFIATWLDHRDGFDNASYAQAFDATGARTGPEMVVVGTFADPHTNDFIRLSDGTYRAVYDYIYASDGTPFVAGETTYMNTAQIAVPQQAFLQSTASMKLAAMANGRYALAGVAEDSRTVVVAVRDSTRADALVHPDGLVTVSEVPNALVGNPQVAVLGLADGGLIVAWTRVTSENAGANYDIMMQAFNSDLQKVGGNVVAHESLAGTQNAPFLTERADGRVVVGWTSDTGDLGGLASDLYGRVFTVTGTDTGSGPSVGPTAGNDMLDGTAGADVIDLLGGNDSYAGLGGADTIDGSAGADTLDGGGGFDVIRGGLGADRLIGGTQGDDMDGGNGDDVILGNDGFDTLTGGAGADLIEGHKGADLVQAGQGADTIFGNLGADTVHGGDGRDLAYLGSGDDVFHDTTQAAPLNNDTVWAGDGDDNIYGGNGFDAFYGGTGADYIRGGKGFDSLYGGDQSDTIDGNDGNDLVYGGRGGDTAYLGRGADTWVDDAQTTFGDDVVYGGGGWDTIQSRGGDDRLTGGAGSDTFVFGAAIGDATLADYAVGEDAVQLEFALWTGPLTGADLDSRASTLSGEVVLTLDTGATLTFEGVTSTAGLLDDITLI